MTTDERRLQAEADRRYERYARPLERDQWGEYVAVSADGETRLGQSVTELLRETEEEVGSDLHIFKIGPRVVGRWL